MMFTGAYTLGAWALLFAFNGVVAAQFGLTGDGGVLVFWFAVAVTPLFFFNGMLFVANASFNNLNRPIWSTFLNWGKNTIGVAPSYGLGRLGAARRGFLSGRRSAAFSSRFWAFGSLFG